ncbi:hypothetical protein [uncultured Kordia sp.]|uniref:hypothetical protein n=1 Tax=uncultured Kordia sp. TaxID=507699 RepID=UPI0026305652|nr:hypothetical protein [uncultured Kordia sp.]
MLIRSSSIITEKISFTVQTKLLLEAINNTDIGLGTSANPILIDGFVSINDANLYEFFSGETIAFQLESDYGKEKEFDLLPLELVGCHIHNVGQDFNRRFVSLPNPWENIFDTAPKSIIKLPDGSLSIEPIDKICAITVAKGLDDKVLDTYVSYRVVLKSTTTVKNAEGREILRTFYFVIDPLIKITSGRKGGGKL